jgi:DNA (cytosine-5)-methyltransferase 1
MELFDADATISYAAVHCDLDSHLNDEVPSKEEMIAYLQPLNWWKNEKPLNLERYGKLKELYLAQRLTNNLGDLNQLDDLPQADLITWSTPCQDFSNAGLKAGFTGHKGSLTHATVELFQKMSHKPTFLLFENVPMIVSETFRDGFDDVFRQIADLGYENILLKLNAKHYGIPQNRDRIFVLSIRKGYEANYSKPKPIDLKLRLKDMLEDEVDASFYLSDIQLQQLQGHDIDAQELSIANPINSMEYDGFKELSPTLKARDYKDPKWVYTPHTDVGVVVAGQFQPIDRDYNKKGIKREERFETRSDELSNTVMTDGNDNMIALGIAQRGRENGQEFELNGGEFANAITTVQKDSMIATTQCINSKVNGKQPKVQDRIYDEQGISTAVTTSFMPSVLVSNDYRMYKQAIQTAENNDVEYGDTINPFNMTVDKSGESPTITTRPEGNKTAILPITQNLQIRKLTPRETWRLMGFDDSDFDKASAMHSNSTLYKQAGNSIVVNVLEHILKGLFYESDTV